MFKTSNLKNIFFKSHFGSIFEVNLKKKMKSKKFFFLRKPQYPNHNKFVKRLKRDYKIYTKFSNFKRFSNLYSAFVINKRLLNLEIARRRFFRKKPKITLRISPLLYFSIFLYLRPFTSKRYRLRFKKLDFYLHLNSNYKPSSFYKRIYIKFLCSKYCWKMDKNIVFPLYYFDFFLFFISSIFGLIKFNNCFYFSKDFGFFESAVYNMFFINSLNDHEPFLKPKYRFFYKFILGSLKFKFKPYGDLFYSVTYLDLMNDFSIDISTELINDYDYSIDNFYYLSNLKTFGDNYINNFSIFDLLFFNDYTYFRYYFFKAIIFFCLVRIQFLGISSFYSIIVLNEFIAKTNKSFFNLYFYKFLPSKIFFFRKAFLVLNSQSNIDVLNLKVDNYISISGTSSKVMWNKRFVLSSVSFQSNFLNGDTNISTNISINNFLVSYRNYFHFYAYRLFRNLEAKVNYDNFLPYWVVFRSLFSLEDKITLNKLARDRLYPWTKKKSMHKYFSMHRSNIIKFGYSYIKSRSKYSEVMPKAGNKNRSLKFIKRNYSVYTAKKFIRYITLFILNKFYLFFTTKYFNIFNARRNFYNLLSLKKGIFSGRIPKKFSYKRFNLSFGTPYILPYTEVSYRIKMVALLSSNFKENLNMQSSLYPRYLRLFLQYIYNHY